MEIKFRGIDIKTGEMVFGGGIDSQRDTPIIINHGERHFVDAKTVGQFTGEKDIDDNELYQGDIVDVDGDVQVVRFDGGAFCVDVCGFDYDFTAIGWAQSTSAISKLGNIHQNPELLEQK